MLQIKRSKPVDFLVPLDEYKEADEVKDIPVVYVYNMETAGICRGRLEDIQKWVELAYKK